MILVTGGTGLVGAHLLYQLALSNASILATYRSKEKTNATKHIFSYYTKEGTALFNKIQWIQADITEIPSLSAVFSHPITHVYHCAALVSFDPKDYREMRKVNIEGTANIINFCIDTNVTKFCFVSSIATIGDAMNSSTVDEENYGIDTGNHHEYAITKYGGEMEVWRGSQEGIDVVIVNPGVILGSGFWNKGSGRFFSQVYRNFKWYTEGITGFVGVNDVVKAMIALTHSSICNERFILVAENMSFKHILSNIANGFGKKPPSVKVGYLATEFLWRIDWIQTTLTGKTPLLTKNTAKSSHHTTYYSSSKIIKALQFHFTPISSIIRTVCADYLKEMNS